MDPVQGSFVMVGGSLKCKCFRTTALEQGGGHRGNAVGGFLSVSRVPAVHPAHGGRCMDEGDNEATTMTATSQIRQ